MLMYQEIEKATGVKVEFIHPVAGSTSAEAFNTLLASSELPDMIKYGWSSYAGGPGLNQHPDYLNGYYPYRCQKDALVIWNANIEEARKHALPTLSYSDE